MLSYETTLQKLRTFNDIHLNKLTDIEVNLQDASVNDLIDLYKALEQTKINLMKLRELI